VLKQVLKKIRDKVRDKDYVMTIHAEEEMNADGLSIKISLTGKVVIITVYLI
jgi:hypothetical protein